MMMSSMPQSSAVQLAGGTQSGQPASARSSDFSALLGTSLQAKLAAMNAQPGAIDGAIPLMDLKAVLALLTEVTEGDPGTAATPAAGTVKGDETKALSVMQLLQGLVLKLENRSAGIGVKNPEEGVDTLAAEIKSLFGQDGQLLPELEQKLKGTVNPAVTDREQQLLKLLEQVEDATSGDQPVAGQLAELLAAVNALLNQSPRQSLDQKVETAKTASATPATVQVMATTQLNVPQTQKIETKPEDSVEISPDDQAKQQATPESAKKATSAVDTSGQELQPKQVKSQNASLQFHPAALQSSEVQEKPDTYKQGLLKADAIEIVVSEEAAVQELPQPGALKPELVSSDKTQLFRTDNVMGVSAENRPAQAVTVAPVAEEPATTLSREQIAGQVREKLAEHRFTQDNGQVTIRLHPADLGELKISVRMDDQRLRVEIVAENKTVKDALMENLGSLKDALARQNVEMKQFDVSTGSKQFFNQGFREGRQQEQQLAGVRQAGWLTGRMDDPSLSGPAIWKGRDNALLDMMM